MPQQTQSQDVLATDHLHADLKGRSVRGSVWTVGSQGTFLFVHTVASIVLARMLLPADFGLVAMVAAISSLGQAFSDLGLSEATIQRKDIDIHQVSVLFWVNVGIGLALTLIMVALAPVLVWFYHEPRLMKLTYVMSLTFLIGGLRVQHNALLQRQMRFKAMAIRDIASTAVAVPLAITMAYRGFGYWAIAALPMIWNFAQMVLSLVLVRWIPCLPRRNTRVGSMISFGGKVAFSYLLGYLNSSTDNVLVGWYWGASFLGLYSRAFNLMMLPIRHLAIAIGRVAVPAFSRLQGDPERFARYYLRAVNLMTWAATPVFGYLFVTAKPLIILLLGYKWSEAAPVFQIFSLAALAQLLVGPSSWLFVSRGESGRLSKLTLVSCPIIVLSYVIGLPFGIKGVALSGSLVFVAMLPWVLRYTFRGTDITLLRLRRAILWPVLVNLAGVGLSECALHFIAPHGLVSQLLVAVPGFAVAYALSMLLAPVRREAMALRGILDDLHRRRQSDDANGPVPESV